MVSSGNPASLCSMSQSTTRPASAPLRRFDGAPVRVLVVDDENNLTELLSMALRYEGMEVLRRMRADNPNVPVLFLTARDAVEDRVAGLTAGGDDYVTKPFSLEEVVA